jgi:phosphoribosylamine---glycine ligase
MNLLLLGSGGREHALAWKLAQSPLCQKLFVAPGNPGTAQIAENININPLDFKSIKDFSLQNQIRLVLVGPEEPLVKGIRDFFLADENLRKIPLIGPDSLGARLEGSKDFAKAFMQRHHIPTAHYQTFTLENQAEGLAYLAKQNLPIVLKADGLAAGKGVIICQTHAEAEENLKNLLGGQFGEASRKVVVEQFLKGIEVSVFVLTDGKNYVLLPEAKDYKRIGEGDTGLNTGGMGSVSPVPFANETFMQKVKTRIIEPTLAGLQSESIDYQGFIFIGLMSVNGEPFVIEYNCRLGDPETQTLMLRLETDLAELLLATAERRLHQKTVSLHPETAVTVVLTAGGYPGDYEKGRLISGWDKVKDVQVFQAGTKYNADNQIVTNGGRVMAVSGLAKNLQEALEKANLAARTFAWDGKYFRRDIGLDLQETSD